MVNLFHPLVEAPRAELVRWMQSLLGDYARLYKLRHKRVGHLWQGRYKALLAEDGDYSLESSRYIHLNPAVRPAERWPWSSYRAYTGDPCVDDWVNVDRTLSFFPEQEDYRFFVEIQGRRGFDQPAGSGEDPVRSHRRGALLVVCPHAKHVDGPALPIDLIDQTVLDVDAAGVKASEVSNQLLEAGRRLEGIVSEQFE